MRDKLLQELNSKSDDYLKGHFDALIDVANLYDLDDQDRYMNQFFIEILAEILEERHIL